ncbi:MAG: hypothetical protein ABIH42_06195 [Planctomycetota bacterium]
MKYVAILFILLSSSVVFADEVVLESTHSELSNAEYKVKCGIIEKPEDVTAPEGELVWTNLLIGRKSYLACILYEKERPIKLHIDKNGDKNLTDDTSDEMIIVSDRKDIFWIEYIEGEYKIADTLLSIDMRILLYPVSKKDIIIQSYTFLTGKFTIEEYEFFIKFSLGQKPFLLPSSTSGAKLCAVRVGKKLVTLDEKSMAVNEDNKVVIKYLTSEDENLLQIEAANGLETIDLKSGNDVTQCCPQNNNFYIPEKEYKLVTYRFTKKSGSDIYYMSVYTKNIEVDKHNRIGATEPLNLTPQVKIEDNKAIIRLIFVDALGRNLSIKKNTRQLEPPKVKIIDSNGNVVATHDYTEG